MKTTLFSFLLFVSATVFSQEANFSKQELSINKYVDGVLVSPKTERPPLLIIISGSGPIDRDGNSNMAKGYMLKKLAERLVQHGIASFRYDKRSSKYIKERNLAVNDLTFDMFIDDATESISYFKSKNIYSKIYVLGHSQGSLVGMIAGKDNVDGFISLAGPGVSIDKTIIDQVKLSAPMFTGETERLFDVLRAGKTTDEFPPALASIFNKPSQPFMTNWMQYNPQDEIKALDMPILIINGTNDIQVTEVDANLLHKAAPKSELKIIENMNHVLVIYEGQDRLGNMKSYNEVNRKLSDELIEILVDFIKQ